MERNTPPGGHRDREKSGYRKQLNEGCPLSGEHRRENRSEHVKKVSEKARGTHMLKSAEGGKPS
jgi:hypothetical protein